MGGCVSILVHVCGSQKTMFGASFYGSTFLRQGLSLNQELANWLDGKDSRIPLSLPPSSGVQAHSAVPFCIGAEDLNLGPHARMS